MAARRGVRAAQIFCSFSLFSCEWYHVIGRACNSATNATLDAIIGADTAENELH